MSTLEIMSIIGFFISLIGNVNQFLSYRKVRAHKIGMANKEILSPLTGLVSTGAFPESEDIIALIKKKSREYKIKRKNLYSVEEVVEEIISHLLEQRMIDSTKNFELIKSFRERIHIPSEKEEKMKIKKERKKLIAEKEKEIKKEIKKLVFQDDFEEFKEWNNYRNGIVVQSKDFKHSGNFSLKKDLSGDPDGGFKQIGKHLGFGELKEIIFTGWIYRPLIVSPALGDRLAIEAADFSGYGFCINHSRNTVWIERRDLAKPVVISPIDNINPIRDNWYYFEFHMKNEGKFKLLILDKIGKQTIDIKSFIDNNYLFFTQIGVHGGFPYYVDDLKIETILL